ncbi:uncharacterized protein J4E78_010284 [Alternaria triticimaculans]|uniref:uncharacterized protein n=1 Tax=Alternaria triticimaculans TaxID=297637 RepID=UPI0020C59B41|nr:uncharacterized protein J4E78_010284 [Alternaria triticimaculans]KAI4641983.1 hypothetical protein J4E78_010284 [Alternaria triticimaculans]
MSPPPYRLHPPQPLLSLPVTNHIVTMTTHTTTTLLAFTATSPAWPTTPALTTINLGRDIAMEVLATEANQDRLRAHQDRLRALQEGEATADELKELETISGELLLCVQRFEAFLARWDGEVLGLGLEEGGMEEEMEEGEIEEGEVKEDEMEVDKDSPSPPPHGPERPQRLDPAAIAAISVGDIGWAPLPRMAATSRDWFIQSAYGQICIKVYPFIIVKKMNDCMIGMPITTAGGNGLTNKTPSLRARSTYVVGANFRGKNDVPYGWGMGPAKMNLEVDQTAGAYEPRSGAFVDVLDTYQIPYNARWKKEGRLTHASRVNLGRMRHAVLEKDALRGEV